MTELEKSGVQLVADNLAGFQGDLTTASRSVSSFGDATQATSGRVGGASQVMIGALRQVGVIAVDAMVAAGKAIGSFVADSIGAAGDFEAGMNQFSAVAGGALDEAGLKTKDFRDLFITLGKELPVSTAEVQQAATEMIKGGIDPATLAAGGLKQNIQFAAAAMGGDLVQAATVSAKILGGWAEQGATADEKARLLTQATDLLTKAANASTVDVQDLALGLYNVQGTAKATGLSLGETTTTLAELAPRFASSAEAGNSLKNFLVRLQPQTQPAIDAMKALGLYTDETGSKFFDAQGKFVGTAKASQILQDATAGLTDAQRVSLLQTIFGNDAMNTASAMAELGAKGYDDMAASMDKANGVQANAQTMQQGYNTALENFKGSIEALQITIGSVLMPILTNLFNNVLAPAVNTATDLTAAIFGDRDAFDKLSPAAQGVASAVSGAFQTVRGVIGEVIGFIDRVQQDIAIWQSGAASGKTILQSFGLDADTAAFFDMIIGKIGGFIQYLGAVQVKVETAFKFDGVVGAIDAVLGELAKFSPMVAILQGVFQAALPPIQDIVLSVFGIISGFIQKNGADMLADVQTVWGQIQNLITTILPPIQSIVQSVFGAIAQFLKDHGAEIQDFLRETWDSVMTIIKLAIAIIQATIVPAFQAIAQFISDNSAQIQQILSGAWEIIKGVIDAALTIIKGVLTAALQIIQGDWSGAWETIKGMVSRVWEDIKLIFTGAINIIKPLLEGAWNDIKTKAETAWSGIKGAIQGAVDGLVSIIEGLPNQVAGVGEAVVQAIWDGIAARWSELVDWFNSKLQDLKDQLPFSEPKDSSSPLYGLAKSGAAIVRNLSMGVAAASAIPVPAVAIAGGGMVAPPASPAQQAAQNNSYSYSQTGNTYNYSPTYAGAPKAPLTSFLTMKAFEL